jgi:hypothetical protein
MIFVDSKKNTMKNKKWNELFESILYATVSLLWILTGALLTYYYNYTNEGMNIAMMNHKYPFVCFIIGLGISPLVRVNYFVKLFIFSLGIVAIEAGII